jgi:enoyl-CoA hydratase/carnithine racemase
MGEQDVLFSKLGSIAHITINRAEALNALNDSVLKKLDRVLDDIEKDPSIIAAVITGAGDKAFIAGADVKEIKEAGSGRTAFIGGGQQTIYKINVKQGDDRRRQRVRARWRTGGRSHV